MTFNRKKGFVELLRVTTKRGRWVALSRLSDLQGDDPFVHDELDCCAHSESIYRATYEGFRLLRQRLLQNRLSINVEEFPHVYQILTDMLTSLENERTKALEGLEQRGLGK